MSQLNFGIDKPTAPSSKNEKPEKNEPTVLSVSQVNRLIKRQLEGQFSSVWLQGEISNFTAHSSGHFYFSLKDKNSQISAVMFRGHNSKLKFKPKAGMEVIVKGKLSVYEPRGNYQMFCETMEPLGAGALQQAFEQLKQKLRQEGLFETNHKKQLPLLPKHIALVTSPTGAAVQDMLNVLSRRSKSVRVTVVPCVVQGESAPASIVKGLIQANQMNDVDVIIVGRGGGSIEDLWGFNSELVARTIHSCQKPVISAVGHEIDFTIADFVSDLRAPTPSAAAELVVKNAAHLTDSILLLKQRLVRAFEVKVAQDKKTILSFEKRLTDPRRRLQDLSIRCDELIQRLQQSTKNYFLDKKMKLKVLRQSLKDPADSIDQKKSKLKMLKLKLDQQVQEKLSASRSQLSQSSLVLDSLSPLKVVDRGYAIVTSREGLVIKNAKDVKEKQTLDVKLAKGQLTVQAIEINREV